MVAHKLFKHHKNGGKKYNIVLHRNSFIYDLKAILQCTQPSSMLMHQIQIHTEARENEAEMGIDGTERKLWHLNRNIITNHKTAKRVLKRCLVFFFLLAWTMKLERGWELAECGEKNFSKLTIFKKKKSIRNCDKSI